MKATELMIGDWVLCDGKPYRIAEIGGMVCLDAEEELFASLEEIEPIPITVMFLIKNGWDKKNKMYWRFKVDDTIELEYYEFEARLSKAYIHKDGRQEEVFICSAINYVHTFQHALKLCGIDKEIVWTSSCLRM